MLVLLVFLDGGIGMIARGGRGLLLLAKEMWGIKKMAFELDPGLVGRVFLVPSFAVIKENAGVEYESESGVHDLLVGHGLVAGIHFGTLFNLIDEHFKGGVGIPRLVHAVCVGLHFRCSELPIVCEEMRKNF